MRFNLIDFCKLQSKGKEVFMIKEGILGIFVELSN